MDGGDTGMATPLNRANQAKEDEFYTQLSDIESELKHYRKHFAGKTVLCNCDDPFESNFFKYFCLNFNRLKLKKLIATCYSGSLITGNELTLFGDDTEEERRTPYKAVVTSVRDANGDGATSMVDVAELFKQGENLCERLEGNGDFRSEECLRLLDEADIVVTNPPFSKFREFVSTLVEHDKKFIIIGNQNAITYKEFFPYCGITKSGWAMVVAIWRLRFQMTMSRVKRDIGKMRAGRSGDPWKCLLVHQSRHQEAP